MDPLNLTRQFLDRLEDGTATVCVLGLGYVGLPLLEQIHDAGFPVVGFDTDESRVSELRSGVCSRSVLNQNRVRKLFLDDQVQVTSDPKSLQNADVFWICVPTPGWQNKPDLANLVSAFEAIGGNARRPCLILVSSTSYPGSCREIGASILKHHGLVVGKNVWLVVSPEREDPGNPAWNCKNIPRVFAGSDAISAKMGSVLLGKLFQVIHEASSLEAAEAGKLLENSFRAVNIAFANEWADMAGLLGLDVFELIRLASTKPFGFLPFYPGPGVGGHCIPVDPLYLLESVKTLGGGPGLVELACTKNMMGPGRFVQKLTRLLSEKGIALAGAKVLVLGVTYKKNVADVRHSPALEVLMILRAKGCQVGYLDPFVPVLPDAGMKSIPMNALADSSWDVTLRMVEHDAFEKLSFEGGPGLVLSFKDVLGEIL